MGDKKLNSLFFADDGLLLARSVEEAKRIIGSLKVIAAKYGLEMNLGKSKCMLYNVRDEIQEVEGLEVVEELQYLGVRV